MAAGTRLNLEGMASCMLSCPCPELNSRTTHPLPTSVAASPGFWTSEQVYFERDLMDWGL
jgi:hypothetical protein